MSTPPYEAAAWVKDCVVEVHQGAGTGSGQFWQLLCEQGGLMVVPGKSGILVVAITAPDVNAGLVRLELLRAAEGVA